MQHTDDSVMLLALKGGEIKAYQYFFMKYYKPLCLKARMMLDSMEEAEQLVRHVFVEVWEEKLYLEIEHSVGGYFYRMVHNNCVNVIRKKRSDDRLSNDPGFLLMQEAVFPFPGYVEECSGQVALEFQGNLSIALSSDYKKHSWDFLTILQKSIRTLKAKCNEALKALRLQIRL